MERLQAIHKELRQRKKKYMAMNEEINDQALHFEIMINRLRPDLLKKAQDDAENKPQNTNNTATGKLIDEENPSQLAKDILVEHGVLRHPYKPTVLLDQITVTKPPQRPESPP